MSLSTTSIRLLNNSRDGDVTASLGSLFQCLTTLSVKKFFLISNLNLPWHNLRPFPLAFYRLFLRRRDKHPPCYNLLSAAPHKTSAVDPSPASLPFSGLAPAPQCLSCSEGPKTEHRDDHFPTPAGHTIPDTSQDAVGLLGHLGTLLAHIQLAIDQYLQVLFHQAAFQPLFPKPVALHGVVVTQVQDQALSLVERHTIGLGALIQPVQIPLQSLPTPKQINTPTQLGVICKLSEGALNPLVPVIDKDIKQNWPQHRALGNTACDRPPAGFNSIHHNTLGPAIQPVFYPAKSTPVQAMSSQFLQENAVGNRVKGFTKVHYLIQTSFKYLQGWRLNHFPGQPVPMLDNPLGEEKFPNIQSKPPLAQLEAISSCPITCYLGEETDPHLSTTSFQVVVESDEVSPQPPFLQAKQSQLPQPLLIRLLLQTSASAPIHSTTMAQGER
ncbi:hypothetical protein QYF61_011292, partial [Mycteria americana]